MVENKKLIEPKSMFGHPPDFMFYFLLNYGSDFLIMA